MITLLKYEDTEAVLVQNLFSAYSRSGETIRRSVDTNVNKNIIESVKASTLIPVQNVCNLIGPIVDSHIRSLIKFEDDVF